MTMLYPDPSVCVPLPPFCYCVPRPCIEGGDYGLHDCWSCRVAALSAGLGGDGWAAAGVTGAVLGRVRYIDVVNEVPST